MQDMLNLKKLLESVEMAEKIAEDTEDTQVYNVLSQKVNESLFENMDGSEMEAVVESCKEINPEVHVSSLFALESKVNSALEMLESMDDVADTAQKVDGDWNINKDNIRKGSRVMLKNPATGTTVEVEITGVSPKAVQVKGKNGGFTNLSRSQFYAMLQHEVRTENAELVFPIKEEKVEKKAEAATSEAEKKTEATVSETEVEPEKVETLPSDLAPLVEKELDNTIVEPATETSDKPKHATALSQDEFLKMTVKAEKDAKPTGLAKLPENKFGNKLFENAEKFSKFVGTFKTEKNSHLIEAVLEAFQACLENEKKKTQ